MESIIVILVALLIFLLSYPLVRRKVKRNIFYGYRVSVYAFQDEEIWYHVNEVGGKHLVALSAWLALCGLIVLIGGASLAGIIFPIMAVVLVAGMIFSIIYTIRLARRMAKEKGLRK